MPIEQVTAEARILIAAHIFLDFARCFDSPRIVNLICHPKKRWRCRVVRQGASRTTPHEDRSPCFWRCGLQPRWAAVARGTLTDARESDFRGVWHPPSSSSLSPHLLLSPHTPPPPPHHHHRHTTNTTTPPPHIATHHHTPHTTQPPTIKTTTHPKRLQPRGRVRRLIFSQFHTPSPTPRALGGKTGPHWRHGAHRGLRGSRSTDMPNYHPVAAARQQKKRIAPHSNENQRRREQQRRASPAAQRTQPNPRTRRQARRVEEDE